MVADVYGDFAGWMCVMGVVLGAWIAHGAALIYRDGINELVSRVWAGIITRKMNSTVGVTLADVTPRSIISPMRAMNDEFRNGNHTNEQLSLNCSYPHPTDL
jgi:hypothetical protein